VSTNPPPRWSSATTGAARRHPRARAREQQAYIRSLLGVSGRHPRARAREQLPHRLDQNEPTGAARDLFGPGRPDQGPEHARDGVKLEIGTDEQDASPTAHC
jgi:hypothetical protein